MIEDYLNQTIFWRQRTAETSEGYSQPGYSAPVAIKGRWRAKRRLVRNALGEGVLSEVSVTLASGTTVALGDGLSLDGRTFLTVIALGDSPDLGGASVCQRVFL